MCTSKTSCLLKMNTASKICPLLDYDCNNYKECRYTKTRLLNIQTGYSGLLPQAKNMLNEGVILCLTRMEMQATISQE